MLWYNVLSVMLLLTTQFMAIPALAGSTSMQLKNRDVTAQDFKALATTTTGQGGKRGLLQSTAFSDDFYRIVGATLQGDSGDSLSNSSRLFATLDLPASYTVTL